MTGIPKVGNGDVRKLTNSKYQNLQESDIIVQFDNFFYKKITRKKCQLLEKSYCSLLTHLEI